VALKIPHYGGVIDPQDNNDPRAIIVQWVHAHNRVLEIGCGTGTISVYLKKLKRCDVLAVESDATMCAEARAQGIDVLLMNIEEPATQTALAARAPFDAIIFADVLEHLRDPLSILVHAREWLSREGVVLVSIPNVAHWTIRLRLLFGQFEYTDGFLMDRTHLRFFTRASARAMFATAGYAIDAERVRWAPFPGDRLWRRVPILRNAGNRFLARVAPGVYGYQFVFKLYRRDMFG
jgi:methionine biosynthesis protein MetW